MFSSASSFAIERHAFIVGVNEYDNQTFERLDAPARDAMRMAKTISDLGYQLYKPVNSVGYIVDPESTDFKDHFDRFISSVPNGSDVVFYFSGHGVGHRGDNYLMLRDANITSIEDLDRNQGAVVSVKHGTVSVSGVLSQLKRKNPGGVNVLFLDACRDIQTFERSGIVPLAESKSRGSVDMFDDPPPRSDGVKGSFIGFAASYNQVAVENSKSVFGIFTDELVSALKGDLANRSIESMFNEVSQNVSTRAREFTNERTNRPYEQRPQDVKGIDGEFCLGHCAPMPEQPSRSWCATHPKWCAAGTLALGAIVISAVNASGDSEPSTSSGVQISLPVP